MSVTLSDEEWGKMVVALTTMANGFHSMTAASAITAKATGEAVDVVEQVNLRLKAGNRAERRKHK
jgi:hypothetical protein